MGIETDDQGDAKVPTAAEKKATGKATAGREKATATSAPPADTPSTDVATTDTAPQEPSFSRDRVLGPEGEQISGVPLFVLTGALADSQADEFTRTDIAKLVDAFHSRKVESEPGALTDDESQTESEED